MGNELMQKVSQRKQVRSALERIDSIEAEFPRLVMAMNEAINSQGQQFDTRLSSLAGVVEALVEILGVDIIDAKMKEISDGKKLKQLEAAKAALEQGIKNGNVVPADVIGDKSLIVARELDAKGEVLFPGRAQLQLLGLAPEFQEKLKGQAPGFVLETTNGSKLEVQEVYDIIEKPQAEASPEAPADAPTASVAASPTSPVADAPSAPSGN